MEFIIIKKKLEMELLNIKAAIIMLTVLILLFLAAIAILMAPERL